MTALLINRLSLSLSLLFQTASEARSLEVAKRPYLKYVCVSVCVSVCPSVFYLQVNHWRDRNEIFSDRRHHPLDDYYILETYCYYVNFKVMYEKLSSHLILVTHIHTYL